MRALTPTPILAGGALLLALIAAFAVNAIAGLGADRFFGSVVYQAITGLSALLIAAAALRSPRHRLAFGLLAGGFGLGFSADVAWELLYAGGQVPPIPSVADGLYLSAYPLFAAGVLALGAGRDGRRSLGSGLWLDGVIVALTLTAVLLLVVVGPRAGDWAGLPLTETLTNVAYPVGDALLIAAISAALALREWRADARLAVLLAAFTTFVVADSLYLAQVAGDAYQPAGPVDLTWLVATGLVALAAWMPARQDSRRPSSGQAAVYVPALAGAVCIAAVVIDHATSDDGLVLVPASLALLTVLLRVTLVLFDNHRLVERSNREASTDQLTGLANRRALLAELERAAPRDRALVLFDLDGFKQYNDRFGHPAGDALLQLVGDALRDAVGTDGTAYRLGGDEFCAILEARSQDPDLAGRRLAGAMIKDGDGFHVGASFGAVVIPAGAPAPDTTLGEADERLYAHKASWRAPSDRSAEVLLALVAERTPALGEHGVAVAARAAGVAQRLGLQPHDVELVRRAAALHDIGKMAIPDSVLAKAGPLDDDEWRLMHQHTLIGERILAAAPTLRPIGRIVRSSHERWDGRGYPDALRGEAIPLGARIVAACDALDAMTADRPYRPPRSIADALAELERCAGGQFDPDVVAALVAEVRGGTAAPPEREAPPVGAPA